MKKLIVVLALMALALSAASADVTLDWLRLDTTAENGFTHEGANSSYGYRADITGWNTTSQDDTVELKISGLSAEQNTATNLYLFLGDSVAATSYYVSVPFTADGVYAFSGADFGSSFGTQGDSIDTTIIMFHDANKSITYPVFDDDTITVNYFTVTLADTQEVPEPATFAVLLAGLVPAALKVKKAIK